MYDSKLVNSLFWFGKDLEIESKYHRSVVLLLTAHILSLQAEYAFLIHVNKLRDFHRIKADKQRRAIFSIIYDISPPNFAISRISRRSFQLWWEILSILSASKFWMSWELSIESLEQTIDIGKM